MSSVIYKRLNRNIIFAVVSLFLVMVAAGFAAEKPANLVQNPSFELKDGKPLGWASYTWGGKAEFGVDVDAATGERYLKVSSTEGADAGWQNSMDVRPFSKYRFSAWIKTDGLIALDIDGRKASGALYNVHNLQPYKTRALTGTNDWTKVDMEFEVAGETEVVINCLLGGWGLATGTAWYKEPMLELLSSQSFEMAVTIKAAEKGEPISKYIYGQFIEHLGRCIYGGCWAEMLEDRKFIFPIKDDLKTWIARGERGYNVGGKFQPIVGSPWLPVGGRGIVTMEKENAYAGEHTPVVKLAGDKARGIEQGELALRAGKGYEGRVVLSGGKDVRAVEVSLIWGDGEKDCETIQLENVGSEWKKYPLKFKAAKDVEDGKLCITAKGDGSLRIGAVSLMPDDNVQGWRADTLELLKELDSPVYRWPGGNFVSGYDWRDGIGDPDKRPPKKNPAWTGIELNDVGLHEFMTLCRILKTEPYVALNTGLGSIESAADEVEYCNGAATTAMGKERAENGAEKPFAVKFWAVGNEMFGNWQLGVMPLSDYVKKHNACVAALREKDPDGVYVAVGAVGNWSRTMLSESADYMNLMSEHFYRQEQSSVPGHVAQMVQSIRSIADAHREYRKTLDSLKGKDIRIAMDEWNYWYGPQVFGELGTRYFQKDGMGIAAGLHEFYRNSDIYYMANYAQTVNVIGCIKTDKTQAMMESTGLVLQLYRREFGEIPLAIEGTPRPLDVTAAWTKDGKALTIAVVNPLAEEVALDVAIEGAAITRRGRMWTITDRENDPNAFNEIGEEPRITLKEKRVAKLKDKLTVGPMSVSLFRFPAKAE